MLACISKQLRTHLCTFVINKSLLACIILKKLHSTDCSHTVYTCVLVQLYFEVGGQNNVEIARLVECGHLISTQLKAVAVVVPADVHQFLFPLRIKFCMVTCVPSQLEKIGVAAQASNLVKMKNFRVIKIAV